MVEIARDIEITRTVAVRVAREAMGEQFRRLVRTHRQTPCQSKAGAGWFVERVVAVLPSGVGADRLALQVVQGEAHRGQRRGADDETARDAMRVFGRPG